VREFWPLTRWRTAVSETAWKRSQRLAADFPVSELVPEFVVPAFVGQTLAALAQTHTYCRALNQLQLGQSQQIARIVGALGGALACQLVVSRRNVGSLSALR
jgi:hypothetical protein